MPHYTDKDMTYEEFSKLLKDRFDKGEEIIVEKDDFYYSVGEAENAAINQMFTEDINSQDIEEDWGSEYEASLEPKLYGLVVKLKKDYCKSSRRDKHFL